MKLLFDEYSSAIFEALVCIFVYVFFVYIFLNGVLNTNVEYIGKVISPIDIYTDNELTHINEFKVRDILIDVNEKINYRDYISASNTRNEDISSYVSILNMPDISKEGEYELSYLLRYNGETKAIKAKLIIIDKDKEIKDEDNV